MKKILDSGNRFNIGGFTLIETLLAIAILGVVIGVAVTVFSSISKSQYQARVKQDLTVTGNRIMDIMIKVIRDGSSASAAVCGSGTSTAITVTNLPGSVEYSANGNCPQTVFSQGSGVNSNGIIQKSYPSCGSGIGAGTITEDNGKSAVDVSTLNFCVRTIASSPKTLDINMTLSPNKAWSTLAPVASQLQTNFSSSVGQRTYTP